MRMEQRQLLTPRMIQSMEILQLPLMALEERIEQELSANPTLEQREGDENHIAEPETERIDPNHSEEEQMLIHRADGVDDFERLYRIGEMFENAEFINAGWKPGGGGDGDRDKKMDAMANTAARVGHLSEYLLDQWRLVDASPVIKRAGELIIDHIDAQGYLRTSFEQILEDAKLRETSLARPLAAGLIIEDASDPKQNPVASDRSNGVLAAGPLSPVRAGEGQGEGPSGASHRARENERRPSPQLSLPSTRERGQETMPTVQDLNRALKLIQDLDPPGIGARDLSECLALQLAAIENDDDLAEGHDFDLEYDLVEHYLKDLEQNRYPQISKKTGKPIDAIQRAVRRLARLHPNPGKQIAVDDAPPITPDANIYFDDQTGKYEIQMTHDPAPNLYISGTYRKMIKDRGVEKATRDFLATNARNAKWLIEAIEQRRNTIYRVIRVVVDAQQEFFEKGPEFLKPLPMISVADQLGIHVATVSRAVSEKWIQTPRGVYPLRRFFSGGTTNAEGEDVSWDAVKEKLRILIDNEDKSKPLNDDEIVDALKAGGIDLARRTVAKYRKIMNIPTARQRKKY